MRYHEVFEAARHTCRSLAYRCSVGIGDITARGGHTASCEWVEGDNRVNIHLPSIKPDTLMTGEQVDAILGTIIHELGHGVWTEKKWVKESFKRGQAVSDISNAIEDPRIEKMQILNGPYNSRELLDIQGKTWANDVAKVATSPEIWEQQPPFRKVGLCLAAMGRSDNRIAREPCDDLLATLPQDLVKTCEKYRSDVNSVDSTEKVVELATRIVKEIPLDNPPEEKQQQVEDQGSEGEGEGKDGGGEDREAGGQVGRHGGKDMYSAGTPASLEQLPEASEQEKTILELSAFCGEIKRSDRFCSSRPHSKLIDSLTSHGRLRSQIGVLLESVDKISKHRRELFGRIDRRRIGLSERRADIFTKRDLAIGETTAVYVLIDQSSSMSGYQSVEARKMALLIAGAVTSRGAMCKVAGFCNPIEQTSAATVNVVKDWRDRKGWQAWVAGMQFECGTYMTPTIAHAIGDLLSQRVNHRILLVLTDGDDSFSKESQKKALKVAKDSGVHVIGLGVSYHLPLDVWKERGIYVSDAEALSKTAMDEVLKVVKRGKEEKA